MGFTDFVVKYDPKTDTKTDLAKRILYAVWIKRLKNKKPVRIFIAGKSGEGKSYTSIMLQQILFEIMGLDIRDYFEAVNIFTPLEYPTKMEALLMDKKLKKAFIVCMQEAREIVKATDWQRFLSVAVSDVHALSRTVKRMIFLIISQSIKNITREMRYTIDFYCTIRRPRGKKPRLSIWVMYIDERDLEKPKLRKRKLSGYIQYPSGIRRRFIPTFLEISKPDKDLIELFERKDFEAKSGIIKNKLAKLIQSMKVDIGDATDKVVVAVDWYTQNPHAIDNIGKTFNKKWKLTKDAREKLLQFDKKEASRFEKLLQESLIKNKVMEEETEVKDDI